MDVELHLLPPRADTPVIVVLAKAHLLDGGITPALVRLLGMCSLSITYGAPGAIAAVPPRAAFHHNPARRRIAAASMAARVAAGFIFAITLTGVRDLISGHLPILNFRRGVAHATVRSPIWSDDTMVSDIGRHQALQRLSDDTRFSLGVDSPSGFGTLGNGGIARLYIVVADAGLQHLPHWDQVSDVTLSLKDVAHGLTFQNLGLWTPGRASLFDW